MIENNGSGREEFRLDRHRIPCKCKAPPGSPSGHTFIKYLSFFIHAVKKYKDEVLVTLPLEILAVVLDMTNCTYSNIGCPQLYTIFIHVVL